MRSPEHKLEPLDEPYTFGKSQLFVTPEGGIKKAVPLQDDFTNATADEVFAVVQSRSRTSHYEPKSEKVNLENFVRVILPPLQGKFRYNDAIMCSSNPEYPNQEIYVSRDIAFDKDGKIYIPANTEITLPKGSLINKEFPDHITNFINLPLILTEDTEVQLAL